MINSLGHPELLDGEIFSFCHGEKGRIWLKWLLWLLDVKTWSQLRRGSSSACCHPLWVPKEKQKLYHPALRERPQSATVKQQSNIQRPIGRDTCLVTPMMMSRSGIPPTGRQAGRGTA